MGITIAGVWGTKQIFNSLGESAIEERDEQLFNTGLTLQNHDNQPAYMVKSKQEYNEREDGYSIILGNEKIGSIGAKSCQYNNYGENRLM